MKLKEAIKPGKSIVCENQEQFDDVLIILERNKINGNPYGEGKVITLCEDDTFFIGPVYFPAHKLAASEFITNNS